MKSKVVYFNKFITNNTNITKLSFILSNKYILESRYFELCVIPSNQVNKIKTFPSCFSFLIVFSLMNFHIKHNLSIQRQISFGFNKGPFSKLNKKMCFCIIWIHILFMLRVLTRLISSELNCNTTTTK